MSEIIINKFGRLTALEDFTLSKARKKVKFRCDCGVEKFIRKDHVKSGLVKSCGCYNKEVAAARHTHGCARLNKVTAEYKIWCYMITRCTNPNAGCYKRYGGRGITVCERWRKFENFLADMGTRPDGLTIERKDNSGNYEPGNCKWATRTAQANNRRSSLNIAFGGKTMTLAEWGRTIGMPAGRLYQRIRAGWSIEKTLTTQAAWLRRQARANFE